MQPRDRAATVASVPDRLPVEQRVPYAFPVTRPDRDEAGARPEVSRRHAARTDSGGVNPARRGCSGTAGRT